MAERSGESHAGGLGSELVCVLALDPGGRVMFCEGDAQRAGLGRGDPTGRTLVELHAMGPLTPASVAIAQAQGASTTRMEVRGRLIESRCAVSPDGSVRVAILDVSRRAEVEERLRLTEEAIRESEERLELALLGADLGLWDWDLASNEVVFNERWAGMLGYSWDEVTPDISQWSRLVHPDDRARAENALRDHWEGRSALYECEHRLLTKNGGWRWILARGRVVRWSHDGRPLRMVGTHLDTTDRRMGEEARREKEERAARSAELQAITRETVEAAAGGAPVENAIALMLERAGEFLGALNAYAWTLGDPEPRCVGRWKPRTRAMTGHEAHWWASRTSAGHAAVIGDASSRSAPDQLRESWRSEGVGSLLALPVHPAKGERLVIVIESARPRSWPAEEIALLQAMADSLARAIERREASSALRAALDEAERANSAKSAFLANMSHEIRTPIGAVLGYADMLDRDSVPRDRRRDLVRRIHLNGAHLLALINDVLDLSKIEAGKVEIRETDTDPARILSECVDMMRTQAQRKGLRLAARAHTPIPAKIRTDPARIRQIILNLLSNAIKFTEKGYVEASLSADPSRAAPTLRISVRDTGVGIEPTEIARIFEPFEQSDRARESGTGLGLAISARLAHLLEGSLTCDSAPGAGSTFTLEIPAIRASHEDRAPGPIEPPALSATRAAADPSALRGARLLIVEDTEPNRDILRFYLEEAGASVDEAHDAESCLARIDDGEDPWDVILMDVQLPAMSGLVAARALRDRGYDRPIVALTARALAGDREEAIAAGCDDYLAKPVSSADLIATVRRLAFTDESRDLDRAPPLSAHDDSKQDRLEALRARYVAESPAWAGELRDALEREDWETARQRAHRIAGTAGAYGFPDTTAAARAFETSVRENHSADVKRARLAMLIRLVEQMR